MRRFNYAVTGFNASPGRFHTTPRGFGGFMTGSGRAARFHGALGIRAGAGVEIMEVIPADFRIAVFLFMPDVLNAPGLDVPDIPVGQDGHAVAAQAVVVVVAVRIMVVVFIRTSAIYII